MAPDTIVCSPGSGAMWSKKRITLYVVSIPCHSF